MLTETPYLFHCLLPVWLQAVVVFAALWWAAWERGAFRRAALFAVLFAGLQSLLLLPSGSAVVPLARCAGYDAVLAVQVLLLLPGVFLMAWLGMRADIGRAHEAVGMMFPAVLLALVLRGYDASVLLISLIACFLCFYLPNLVANNAGNHVSGVGLMRHALAQTVEYWGVMLVGVMLRYYLPHIHEFLTYLCVLAVPAVIEFMVAVTVVGISARRALLWAVLSSMLLPVLWIVCSMMQLYW